MGGHLYNFGISQEDERSEYEALAVDESSRLLSVCSAGDMPLSLLAMGAGHVLAVDIDESQLHLARIKLAAVCELEREEAARFLGYLPWKAGARSDLFSRVAKSLPEPSLVFWREQKRTVDKGVVWAGRYERYVTKLVRALRLVIGRKIDGLFSCSSIEEQMRYFQKTFDRRFYRFVFELAFHPMIFAKRGMDPRSLQHRQGQQSLGQQYFGRFEAMCTTTPVAENHLLQLHLLGRVSSLEALPAYLSSEGFERVRERREQIELRHGDLVTTLKDLEPQAFNGFHLSNLPDWMSESGFGDVMELLAAKSARPAKAVWRFIHVDRPVPPTVASCFQIDLDSKEGLNQRDRFPFYTIVPATIHASG